MQQRSHRRADEVLAQPGLGRRIAEGGGQGDHVLRLRRQRPLPRRQDAGHALFLGAGALGGQQFGQLPQRRGVAAVIARQVRPQQLDRFRMITAGRRNRAQHLFVAVNPETDEQLAGALRVEGGQRDQTGVAPMSQGRHVEASRQHHDAGQRFRRQLLQQPAELGVDEPPLPRAVLVLRHLGAVEDQRPPFAPQDRQEMIDAVAGGHVGDVGQPRGVGVQLPEAQIGVLAAVKAPQENAVGPRFVGQAPFQPVLDDGGLALSAGADEGRQARLAAGQRGVEDRQFGGAAEEAVRLRCAVVNVWRSRHDALTTNHTNNTNKIQKYSYSYSCYSCYSWFVDYPCDFAARSGRSDRTTVPACHSSLSATAFSSFSSCCR